MKKQCLRMLSILLLFCMLPFPGIAENVGEILNIGMLLTRTMGIYPLNPAERDIISVYSLVYESLVTIDDNGVPQPLLAENWVESDGGATWTFTLRENIMFSDGTPLLASDVVASCQYILNMAKNRDLPELSRGFYQNMRYLVASIRATDERTVVVKGERSYFGLLYSMTFPIVPAAQVEMHSPVGTGPYLITAFQPEYSRMMLAVNPGWWQAEPQVKDIGITFYRNNKEMINAYEFGQVDTVFTRSVAAAQYKSGISSLSIPYSTRQMETLIMNHREFPLESQKIRLALRYAINTQVISQNAYMGMTSSTNTPIPPDSWLYHDQESAFVFNPARAAELLAEEGWADTDNDGILDKAIVVNGENVKRNLQLRLFVYEDPENDVRFETASLIIEMLRTLKIGVSFNSVTYEQQLERLEAGSFDLALCSFQMDVVPDVGFFLMQGNQQNYGRYNSNEMTSLINTLRTNEDRNDFAYTTQAIQQQFEADVPFICLFYRAGAILTRKMFTTVRSIREFELLRGIEAFGR